MVLPICNYGTNVWAIYALSTTKMMVERLVDGMMLSGRSVRDCETCHLAKQVRKTFKKKLDRHIVQPNQLVYADLLVPGVNSDTSIGAVLVIMDGYSKFVTTYMLRAKAADAVAAALRQYIAWAERQVRRHAIYKLAGKKIEYPVFQLLTDKGGEFASAEFKLWLKDRGIEHVKVGPASSQQNPCERVHRPLMEMTRAMLEHSGMPRMFCTDAF